VSDPPRTAPIKPRLMVNADQAAVNAAVDGEGIVRILSYKIDREIRGRPPLDFAAAGRATPTAS
jgi:hypothetical protein